MTSLDLKDKRVLIREDLNVPIQDGVVTSDARIRASLPTIQAALTARARVLVMSHLGRHEEGKYAEEFSLAPVARRLAQLLGVPVALKKDWLIFFFQAEDGIRDHCVTGVQTCALPI